MKEIKECELCDRTARMYCESDDARLCWECDARVHGANFLVARHTRCLLCRSCQAPTPWKAAGARLGPTVSVCDRCASGRKHENEEEEEGEEDEEEEGGEEEEGEEGGIGEEEEEGDNQVVPWSLPPPSEASSSGREEEEENRICNGFLKRKREENVDPTSQDDLACSSSQTSYLAPALAPAPASATSAGTTDEEEASSFANPFHHSKDRKRAVNSRRFNSEPATDASASAVLNIRNLRDHRAIDLVSSSFLSPPI